MHNSETPNSLLAAISRRIPPVSLEGCWKMRQLIRTQFLQILLRVDVAEVEICIRVLDLWNPGAVVETAHPERCEKQKCLTFTQILETKINWYMKLFIMRKSWKTKTVYLSRKRRCSFYFVVVVIASKVRSRELWVRIQLQTEFFIPCLNPL